MEACCRHLRDGAIRDEAGCAMVLVCDHLGCVGGAALMHRLCSDYLQALAQQRAQASHMNLLQLEASLPAALSRQRAVQAVDGFSDPDGWLRCVRALICWRARNPAVAQGQAKLGGSSRCMLFCLQALLLCGLVLFVQRCWSRHPRDRGHAGIPPSTFPRGSLRSHWIARCVGGSSDE